MRAVLVPGVPALLPAYASVQDPVAELRSACVAAVAWAGEAGSVAVVGTAQGCRVGEALVRAGGVVSRQDFVLPQSPEADFVLPQPPGADFVLPQPPPGVVVVANGSAKRSEGSPGYVDERAVGFDADLAARLRAGELTGIDHDLARELWADTTAFDVLARMLPVGTAATVDYEDDPYGVQYWVLRWEW